MDDDALVRRLLSSILTSQGVDVVGEASDGDEVVAAVQAHRPDVVLMDLHMPRVGGLAAIEALNQLTDPPAVIALTSFGTDESVLAAVRAGAKGFLAKDAARVRGTTGRPAPPSGTSAPGRSTPVGPRRAPRSPSSRPGSSSARRTCPRACRTRRSGRSSSARSPP